jgi:hypothetical protein
MQGVLWLKTVSLPRAHTSQRTYKSLVRMVPLPPGCELFYYKVLVGNLQFADSLTVMPVKWIWMVFQKVSSIKQDLYSCSIC